MTPALWTAPLGPLGSRRSTTAPQQAQGRAEATSEPRPAIPPGEGRLKAPSQPRPAIRPPHVVPKTLAPVCLPPSLHKLISDTLGPRVPGEEPSTGSGRGSRQGSTPRPPSFRGRARATSRHRLRQRSSPSPRTLGAQPRATSERWRRQLSSPHPGASEARVGTAPELWLTPRRTRLPARLARSTDRGRNCTWKRG